MVEHNKVETSSPILTSTSESLKCVSLSSSIISEDTKLESQDLSLSENELSLATQVLEAELKLDFHNQKPKNGHSIHHVKTEEESKCSSYILNEKSSKRSSNLFRRFHNYHNSSKSKDSAKQALQNDSSAKLNIKKLRFKKCVKYSSSETSQNRLSELTDVSPMYTEIFSNSADICSKQYPQKMTPDFHKNKPKFPRSPSEKFKYATEFSLKKGNLEMDKNSLSRTLSFSSYSPRVSRGQSFDAISLGTPKSTRNTRLHSPMHNYKSMERRSPCKIPSSTSTGSIYSKTQKKGNKTHVSSSLHSTPVATPKEILNNNCFINRIKSSSFVSSGSFYFSECKWSPLLPSSKPFEGSSVCRARTNEGGSLTIRIPRHLGGKSTPTFSQPLTSPSRTNSNSRIVAKSKSLTTSMDKLSIPKQRSPSGDSSRDSSLGCSRGSTPSSARSTVVSRPNSRRSVHSVRSPHPPVQSTPDAEDRNGKSFSPAGSEASLHSSQSVNSSTHSVNSSHSVHSVASSNTSVKSQASNHSYVSGNSERGSYARASSEPPNSFTHRKPPIQKVSKSVSPAPLQGGSMGFKKVPIRGSVSISSLNSSSGDVRLEDSHASKMSRKSTPSRQTPPRTPNAGSHRHSIGSVPSKKPLPVFNSYMSLFQVQEKLKKGEVIEGVLRINPKSYEDAYISAPDGGMDIFIGGVRDRNAALHGDVVAALLNPHDEWKVLYSQLDAFLEDREDLRALVYKPIQSNISYPDNASVSTLSGVHNTNVKSHITNKTSDMIFETNCDVVVEEDKKETNNAEHQNKKKKHRRGKKNRDQKDVIDVLKDSFALCKESDKVEDSIAIVSCPSELDIDTDSQIASCSNPSNVVPPHELSECDLSDDNSVSSLTHDFEIRLDVTKVSTSSNDINTDIKCDLPKIKKVQPHSKERKVNSHNKDKKFKNQKVKSNSKIPHENVKSMKLNIASEKNSNLQTKSNLKTNIKENRLRVSVEQVMRLEDWEKFVQKSAVVVHIMEKKHSRLAAGILKQFADKNPHVALFSPFDNRIPRMKIQMNKCPPNFVHRPDDYLKLMFLAKIVEWNDPKFAFGELCKDIGRIGDVEAETECLLLENSIDSSEFPESVLRNLPQLPWIIPEEEIKKRTDLRKSIIFTIDPATARDLDDAVSCLVLPNGNRRVGVHIADASYFVPADSELDKMAANRATSVYLIQKVIPMLPRPLCEELCSLNPGVDRLAFSVIWEMTPDGTLLGEWFGRTIIRSCVKLSYDHVQSIIENPNQKLNPEEFPPISGSVTIKEIASIILDLNKIAVRLRKRRGENGALRLNQVKTGFSLDEVSKTPNGIFSQVTKDSNWLIEEFMLLANISVAQKIKNTFPEMALLRRHPPPHDVQMETAINFLNLFDIKLDATTSKTLSNSIQRYAGRDEFSMARMQLIVNLCSKPMQYAKYFCAGIIEPNQHFHYALNVPCYTHFTSPIRRYADIIVHRLLAAAIDGEHNPLPRWNKDKIQDISTHCNDRKQASKSVQDASVDLYLGLFVRNVGELIENGIIVGILDKAFDVLLLRMGIIKRCYMDKLDLKSFIPVMEDQKSSLFIEWKEDAASNLPSVTQKLSYFDCVTVILRPFDNDALKVNVLLVRPGK